MKKLLTSLLAWTAAVFLSCNGAAAEEFSFKCGNEHGFPMMMFTFNDLTKRVVAYEFEKGRLGRLFRGKINAISADEIDFDLVQALMLTSDKSGTFMGNTLNCREGSLKFGRAQVPTKCQFIPLRSVMDLWNLLSTYPEH